MTKRALIPGIPGQDSALDEFVEKKNSRVGFR